MVIFVADAVLSGVAPLAGEDADDYEILFGDGGTSVGLAYRQSNDQLRVCILGGKQHKYNPTQPYLAVPDVSSENRRFMPIGFLQPEIIASNKIQMIVGAEIYHFGMLSSTMHMAWVRAVGGRLKSDYSYSPAVYNNFPWAIDVTEAQRERVEVAAHQILTAREKFPESTLADLYDPVTMPPALAKAHEALDRAVDRCYRKDPFTSDRQRVEHLFYLYEELTAPFATEKKPRKKRLE